MESVNSYYALYHFIVQHYMQEMDNNKEHRYYRQVSQYPTYVKDLAKALNSPFGYNIPRFKNLTIEALFDRNIQYENSTEKQSN